MKLIELIEEFRTSGSEKNLIITNDSNRMPVDQIYSAVVVLELQESKIRVIKNKLTRLSKGVTEDEMDW